MELKKYGEDVTGLVEKSFRMLFLISILYFIGILSGSYVLSYLLGAKWQMIGSFLRILNPAFTIMFVVSSLSILIRAFGKNEIEAKLQFFSLILLGIFLFGSIPFNVPETTLYLLTISHVIISSIYMFLIFRTANVRIRRTFFIDERRLKMGSSVFTSLFMSLFMVFGSIFNVK